jgi:SPP1 family predicted phage head-tail adaptor
MRGGELDRRIVIQTVTETQDGYGGLVEAWSTFAEVWARKMEQSSKEFFASAQENAEQLVVFRTRWLSGVTTKMRVLYDGQLYDIEGWKELGRREGLELQTRAKVQ